MALTPLEQTISAVNQASRILVAPTADLNGDALGSAFAFGHALELGGKEVCILLPEELPARFSFLPKPKNVTTEIVFDREFVLSIDTKQAPVKELRYEQQAEALKLYLTAPGHFSLEHVSLEGGAHKHDLVVTIGAVDMESLGATFEKYPQMFYDVPVLNIDRHSSNERFGNINMVDVTSSTVAEMMHGILEAWNAEAVNEHIATCLLAGIVDGTKSFQDISVTPKTLTAAAKLLSQGAKQTDVVRYLYKSRSLAQLKLWGVILGKLELHEEYRVAYAVLAPEDVTSIAVEYNPKEFPGILEDMHGNFPHFATIAIFFMHQNGDAEPAMRGLVSSREENVLERIVQNFHAKRRGNLASFKIVTLVPADAPEAFFKECFE